MNGRMHLDEPVPLAVLLAEFTVALRPELGQLHGTTVPSAEVVAQDAVQPVQVPCRRRWQLWRRRLT